MTKYLNTKPGSLEEVIEKLVIQEADEKTMLVVNPAKKKPGVDGVKRIPKEKWPEYQKQGYIQAEETIIEKANNAYAIGMAAAEKATGDKPPLKKSTIVKGHEIAKKILKKEDVQTEELKGNQKKLDKNHNGKLDADDFKKLRKEDSIADKENESQKKKGGEKDFVKKAAAGKSDIINEGGMKEIDTNKKELERLNIRLSNLRDRKNSAGGADTTSIEKEIKQVQMSVIDLKKKLSSKNEEIDPERITKLNKRIQDLSQKANELDKSKPESKTKEAILKSDIATAKLRLQDLTQKKSSEGTTQAKVKVESKMNYKSMKKKLKTEKTLTGQPKTKIDTDPKIN